MHVAVIGTGSIGSTVAYTLAIDDPSLDVTLVDVDTDAAYAHAKDVRHARCHAAHPVGRPAGGPAADVTVESADPGPDALEDADCVVVTASVERVPESEQRGGRLTYLEGNLAIADEIGGWLGEIEPRPLICVTNPMDRITYRLWSASGWPRQSVLGYSLSETARLADWFARREGVSPGDVSCPILGEHGENIVPAFSRATVEGSSVSLSAEERQDALDFVRDAPYDVIEHRGAADSSRWVSGRGVALLAERLLADDVDDPICLSVPLDGEYGLEDVCLSVPVELDAGGWNRIVEWDLSDWERERLTRAYEAVDESLEG